MTQENFFDPTKSDLLRLNPPAVSKKRLFVYDGAYFEDPGPEYSIQEVLAFLARTYPELEQGTWHSRTLPDGTEEITFVKVAGEKGWGHGG